MEHGTDDPTAPAEGDDRRERRAVSRRGFLGGAALTGVAAAATAVAGCTDADTGSDNAIASGGGSAGAAGQSENFRGEHQSGILAGPAAYAVVAAFDCLAPDRATLVAGFQQLSEQLEAAFAPEPANSASDSDAAPDQPPTEPGLLTGLGPDAGTALTHATVSVGASLFDQRYGLADRRPVGLIPMPDGLSGTDVLDPARTHGDLLLVLGGAHPDVALQTLRAVLRSTSSWLRLRWSQETFLRPDAEPRPDGVSTRNLLGFKDGTANPDVSLSDLMDDVVWVTGDSGDTAEPAWTSGGSYQAVRLIRLFVESWDATPLDQQQRVFGRQKANGAPLGGDKESDVPVYPADPTGEVVPLTAHIRLANPRDGNALLMLRRSMSYSRGTDAAGQLDQGLVFLSYQSTLDAFVQAQGRLSGEPLEAFTRTEGGGFFFALPGAGTGGWVGQSLLEG